MPGNSASIPVGNAGAGSAGFGKAMSVSRVR